MGVGVGVGVDTGAGVRYELRVGVGGCATVGRGVGELIGVNVGRGVWMLEGVVGEIVIVGLIVGVRVEYGIIENTTGRGVTVILIIVFVAGSLSASAAR